MNNGGIPIVSNSYVGAAAAGNRHHCCVVRAHTHRAPLHLYILHRRTTVRAVGRSVVELDKMVGEAAIGIHFCGMFSVVSVVQ